MARVPYERWFRSEPLPRTHEAPWLLPAGLLGIGILWRWVYAWLARIWAGAW